MALDISGQKAPPLRVTSLGDYPVPTLSDLTERVTLLFFWHIGCLGCLGRAIPFSLRAGKEHPDLQIIGIHTHLEGPKYSPAQIDGIRQLHHIPYPIFLDKGHKTYEAYGAEGTPHWILIDGRAVVYRSIWGSMPNSLQRLEYAFLELGL